MVIGLCLWLCVFVVAICGVKSDEASSAVNDVGMLQVRARCLRGGEW
jgi:hypothetical protein